MKTICSIVITLASAVALYAGTRVTFDAEVKSRIEYDGGKTNTVEGYESKVFLGADVIDVESSPRITVHDYKDRKIYRSSSGKEGFPKVSLFSDIGFRVSEFRNRLF